MIANDDLMTKYLDRLKKLDECIDSESMDLSYGYACQKSGYYMALLDLGIVSQHESDVATMVAIKKREQLNKRLSGLRDELNWILLGHRDSDGFQNKLD